MGEWWGKGGAGKGGESQSQALGSARTQRKNTEYIF